VAGFIGSPAMNFLDGVVQGGKIDVPGLQQAVSVPVTLPEEGTAVSLGLRPEHLVIDPEGDTHVVELTEALGGVSYAYLMSDTGEKIVVEERGDDRSDEGRADTIRGQKSGDPKSGGQKNGRLSRILRFFIASGGLSAM